MELLDTKVESLNDGGWDRWNTWIKRYEAEFKNREGNLPRGTFSIFLSEHSLTAFLKLRESGERGAAWRRWRRGGIIIGIHETMAILDWHIRRFLHT
jgi:hypothetical protein